MTSTTANIDDKFRTVRQLVWLYFWLLIFEGALRKWILPGLSNPLLIIRDPVAIAIYVAASQCGGFPKSAFNSAIYLLAGINLAISFLVTNPDHPVVTIYGLRANFLHLPLIFVLPQVLTREDVRKIGYAVLLMAPPMAVLVLDQFKSPAEAWINKGAGEGAMMIESAFDRIRPSGTFSFTNGLLDYISLLGSFLFYSSFRSNAYPKWLLLSAVPSLFLMVACSGSRSVLSSITILVIAAVLISVYKPKLLGGSAKVLGGIVAVYLAMGSMAVVQQGAQVFEYRLGNAREVKTGLVDRYFSTLLPIGAMLRADFLGVGIGMGTNAAAGLLTGSRGFMLAENEWERVILESGPALGLAYIALRVALTCFAGQSVFRPLNREGDTLAALLYACGALQLLNGQFAQPAALGFGVLSAGLCLAAANQEKFSVLPDPVGKAIVVPMPPQEMVVRSRSVYGEKLHGK